MGWPAVGRDTLATEAFAHKLNVQADSIEKTQAVARTRESGAAASSATAVGAADAAAVAMRDPMRRPPLDVDVAHDTGIATALRAGHWPAGGREVSGIRGREMRYRVCPERRGEMARGVTRLASEPDARRPAITRTAGKGERALASGHCSAGPWPVGSPGRRRRSPSERGRVAR